ncbi:hypothetical protein I302_106233 [Kwoniella bestiolae CBS 10118]|uniref:CCZ1/INTU/HSP4 first Longin domain-containing protein n=1 Tax=Kwoniella bestiolae CBS 10118 TaxID=1296100 RepID=A0A1B9G388_9TREE|nr:hypothetical protein I302_05357 [Kwoniella bestiolae CBS 10118]OCF25537.1 hypothetical protein I302_05357 [Kwoniella bestiolae CBS 10118]
MPPSTSISSPGPSKIIPASLSHFVIFNPTIKADIPKSDNRDDDDDLREAAQILFYTSREAGGVSRDKMLRQVGLAKGLMGFGNMLAECPSKYSSIHGNRSRLIIYSPEPDFYIYICITLSYLDNEKKDPVNGSQGISDEMLVDGLARGYEDFRLLHGPLSSHTIPSPALSTILDKYFTRFAFQFESTHLSSPSLSSWVEGYSPSSTAPNLFDDYLSNLEGSLVIIGPQGPLYQDERLNDPALIRYLHNLVQSTLPPPALPQPVPLKGDRQTLGFGLNLGLGRKTQNQYSSSRKSSWTTLGGWVPDIRRTSTPTAPASPHLEAPTKPISKEVEDSTVKAGKWGFGLGGIGDAMGNVGNVFGLGRSATPTQTADQKTEEPPSKSSSDGPPTESVGPPSKSDPTQNDSSSSHHVEATPVAVEELEAAVEPDEELEWESKSLWIKVSEDNTFEKRRVCWVIRNNILISVILPHNATPPYNLPSTKATTNLFAKLTKTNDIPHEPQLTTTSPNPCIAIMGKDKLISKGELDHVSDHSLIHLRSALQGSSDVHEIMAKSSSNRFLVAKKNDRQEMYMKVGGDDASLTDADHAVRTFMRLNAGVTA